MAKDEEDQEGDDDNEPRKRVYLKVAEVKDVLENILEQFLNKKTKNFY